MSTTLHGIAIDVLENQRRAAKSMTAAVRGGYKRAYARIDTAWEQGFEMGLAARLDDGLKTRVLSAEKKFSRSAVNGVGSLTGYVDQGLDFVVDGAKRGMRSDTAHKLYATRAYDAISRVSVPVAQVGLKISEEVADRAEQLAARVSGSKVARARTTVKATAKTQATKARRGAKKATTTATKVRRQVRKAAAA